jgi:hypothetical protein
MWHRPRKVDVYLWGGARAPQGATVRHCNRVQHTSCGQWSSQALRPQKYNKARTDPGEERRCQVFLHLESSGLIPWRCIKCISQNNSLSKVTGYGQWVDSRRKQWFVFEIIVETQIVENFKAARVKKAWSVTSTPSTAAMHNYMTH